jgi:hypothetical protein
VAELEKLVLRLSKTSLGKQAGKQARKHAPRIARQVVQKGLSTLPEEAQRYVLALADPMNPDVRGVGGILNARPSQKITVNARGAYTIPNASILYMWFAPSVCSDVPSVYSNICTAAQSTLATSAFQSAAPTGTRSSIQFQTPYTLIDTASAGMAGRILSLGAKFKYTGTVLNQGGIGFFYEDIHGSSSVDSATTILEAPATTDARIQNLQQCRPFHVTKQGVHKFSITPGSEASQQWCIRDNAGSAFIDRGGSMSDFNNIATPQWNNTVFTPNPIGFLSYTNNTGATISVSFDFQAHLEYSGGTATYAHTPSPSMHEVGSNIINAVVAAKANHAQDPDKPLLHHVHNELQRHLSRAVTKFGSSLLQRALKNPGETAAALAPLLM